MDLARILEYLKENVEPLPDSICGNRYRAAVFLKDGTYLPCVVFESKRRQVELAMKRFEEVRNQKKHYRMIVESFVTDRSSVAPFDISKVEISPFAIPLSKLKNIRGESSMGWTEFLVEMNDGRRFAYGTTFSIEFFELPDGYKVDDIKSIHGVSDLEERPRNATLNYYREKPFFTCYLDGI